MDSYILMLQTSILQVLHMSVPLDDDSVQEVPMDPRPSHHFSMDNVSYITKQQCMLIIFLWISKVLMVIQRFIKPHIGIMIY